MHVAYSTVDCQLMRRISAQEQPLFISTAISCYKYIINANGVIITLEATLYS